MNPLKLIIKKKNTNLGVKKESRKRNLNVWKLLFDVVNEANRTEPNRFEPKKPWTEPPHALTSQGAKERAKGFNQSIKREFSCISCHWYCRKKNVTSEICCCMGFVKNFLSLFAKKEVALPAVESTMFVSKFVSRTAAAVGTRAASTEATFTVRDFKLHKLEQGPSTEVTGTQRIHRITR